MVANDLIERQVARIAALDEENKALFEELQYRLEQVAKLEAALKDVLQMIATDDLIPESVSYMREARAVLARVRDD